MAASTFSLKIIATNKIFYDGRAQSLVIPTITGQRGILPHHEEMICVRRAQEAADRARERLRQKKSIEEYRMTQAALARALSRLKFKGRSIE